MGEQDINLDDLQREIKAAERYMIAGRDGVSSPGGRGGARAGIDQERRANILQQFGRQPLGAPSPSAARYADLRDSSSGGVASSGHTDANTGRGHDDDDDAVSVGSVSSRYSTAEEREDLINRLLKEHRARKGGDVGTPPRRGMGDTLKEPLATTGGGGGGGRGQHGQQRGTQRGVGARDSPERVLMSADYDDVRLGDDDDDGGGDGNDDGSATLFFASDLGLAPSGLSQGGRGRTGTGAGPEGSGRSSSREQTSRPHTAHTTRATGGSAVRKSSSVERSRPAWGARPAHSRKTSLSPTPRVRASAPVPTVSAREQTSRDVSRSRGGGAVGWSDDRRSTDNGGVAVGPLMSALGLTGPRKHLKSREVVIMTIVATVHF
jgi:hypothetical protein